MLEFLLKCKINDFFEELSYNIKIFKTIDANGVNVTSYCSYCQALYHLYDLLIHSLLFETKEYLFPNSEVFLTEITLHRIKCRR